MPYEFDYRERERDVWVFRIENSKWLQERFDYENKHYSHAYEFGGDVNEMLIDFKHYLFEFHDQFVEIIARGFWFEKFDESLFKKELTVGHPRLPLPMENIELMTVFGVTCQIRKNPKSKEEIVHDAQFHQQKLFEFALEFKNEANVVRSVLVLRRNDKVISVFGTRAVEFDGIVTLEQIKPMMETYMEEVASYRKERGLL